MIKKILVLILSLTIVGCNNTITPPATPENYNEFTAGATQIAIMTTSTQTIPAPNPSPEAFELKTQVIFRDDFESQLKSGWIWVNESENNWNLNNKAGFLEIYSTGGYFRFNSSSNVLLREAPARNFMIETNLFFDPNESDQFAGLIAIESSQNFLQAGIGYCP
ncbi:MAG: hypothetical protein HC795_16720, partial [Coleofasciculaceae cyanobacterium RL_1_1]|nr:hypothetical protein [Coleofasciculaceae cyanobacterium RL_1_1]